MQKPGFEQGDRAHLMCLIVDDSAFARFHMKRLLGSFENIRTSEAANGNEAVSEYKRLRPDIVFMDIVMPGLEGVETVKMICKDDPGASVIMVSSQSYPEKVSEALTAGAKCFLSKPVTTDRLRMAIDQVLGNANSPNHGSVL
ncbi:MAG TPA: response regulator [Blastocatellia bacterium]|nr:response regulator [Blastocatellia bacterium]